MPAFGIFGDLTIGLEYATVEKMRSYAMKRKRIAVLFFFGVLLVLAVQTALSAASATGTVVWNANMTISAWGNALQNGENSTFNAGIGGPDAAMYTLTDAKNNYTCCGWKIRDSSGTLLNSDGLIYLYYGFSFHLTKTNKKAEYAYITVQTDLWHSATVYSVR